MPRPAGRSKPAHSIPRIGFLFYGSPGPASEIEAFRQELADLGYREGQNIGIEYRFANGRLERNAPTVVAARAETVAARRQRALSIA